MELQKLSEGIGPHDAGPGDLPAIQSGMRVATAVTFQNTGSEARRRLAAAAAAAVAAKPLVCGGGNLTIDASVICKASGSGAADSGNGTFFSQRRSCATFCSQAEPHLALFFTVG